MVSQMEDRLLIILTIMNKIKELKKYVHVHGAEKRGKVLMVVSSPTISGETGWPIGFWASELTHPLLRFQQAGFNVDVVSTEGGEVRMDGYSNPLDESGYSADDIVSLGFLQKDSFLEILKNTKPISIIDHSEYDAIFLVGGQGPMYTFRGNSNLENLFASFFESGKPSAAVCHSTCLLIEAKKSDGSLIVDSKTWTGFANLEEDFADNAAGLKIQPYRIEDEAKKIPNTNFKVSDPFSSYAILDGNLITGQQQNSGEAAADLIIELLSR